MGFVRHTTTTGGGTTPPHHETIYTAPEMRETPVETRPAPRTEPRLVPELLSGGSGLEVLAGAAAIVLSILGLIGMAPIVFGAIACICLGGALLLFSGAVGARWRETGARVQRERDEGADVVGGLGAEAIGGAAGVVLGILALIGLAPVTLFTIAVICIGGGMLFGGAGQAELDVLATERDPRLARYSEKAMKAGGGVMALAGIGGVVLGILGLIGVQPVVVLALVATLVLGGGLLLGGGAGAFRFAPGVLRHRTA